MKKTQKKKESIQEIHLRDYEKFCLLKLFTVHMGLTYDQYDDFCNFDEEQEMFDDLSKSSLESQYFEDGLHLIMFPERDT